MTACDLLNVTMGWKLYSYLESKPQNYDVTFAVGPEKTVVKALKVILKSSSVIFEAEFEETWEESVLKDGEGIPLPDFDPDAFKLFVKLLILDTWSVDALQELNMPANQLMNLLSICRRYEMTIAVQNLQKLYQEFLGTIDAFLKTDDFLEISKNNFETILLTEDLNVRETEIVAGARRWAEKQCEVQNLEFNGENYREVLGNVLFQIRFPTLTCSEFTKVVQIDNFLKDKEIIETYKFIGLENDQLCNCDTTTLPFKVNKRSSKALLLRSSAVGCSVLDVTKLFPVDSNTPFVCNGTGNVYNQFAPLNHKIAVYGFGFLGPIDADSYYDVTVRIARYKSSRTYLAEKSEQKMFSRKGEIFYITLDEPVTIDPIEKCDGYDCYEVYFCLKGPDTQSYEVDSTWSTLRNGDTDFKLNWKRRQLAEIVFKKV